MNVLRSCLLAGFKRFTNRLTGQSCWRFAHLERRTDSSYHATRKPPGFTSRQQPFRIHRHHHRSVNISAPICKEDASTMSNRFMETGSFDFH